MPKLDINHILPKRAREKYDSMLLNLKAVIGRGIEEGLFKPMDVRVIVEAIDGLTNALALSWLGSGQAHLSLEADIRNVTELFLNGALIRQKSTENTVNGKEPDDGS